MTERDQIYPVLLTDTKVCQVHHKAGVGGPGSSNCCEGARGRVVSGTRGASVVFISLFSDAEASP